MYFKLIQVLYMNLFGEISKIYMYKPHSTIFPNQIS